MTVTTTVSSGRARRLMAVDGTDPDDLVAVDQPPVGVDGEHAVGVAVEGDPRVGAVLDHVPLRARPDGWSRTRR